MSRLSNLRTSERLAAKVNLGAAAVTRRLRRLSELRDCCLRLARWGRYWPVSSADGP
jgi:hypothetical protein